MKKLVIIFFLLLIPALNSVSQVTKLKGNVSFNEETPSIIKVNKEEKKSLLKSTEDNLTLKSEQEYRIYIQQQNVMQRSVPEDNSFNLVSSFRKNVRFGGIWGGYAVVNFTPNMLIQPVDFISIYASHNFRNFIPMKSIKENIKPLIIEGAAVLAIDNTLKFLLSSNKIIQAIVSFAAKNIIINMLNDPKQKKTKLGDYRSYYYSLSIRF